MWAILDFGAIPRMIVFVSNAPYLSMNRFKALRVLLLAIIEASTQHLCCKETSLKIYRRDGFAIRSIISSIEVTVFTVLKS